MAIKVVIPENTTNITVGGLHQWDYGQVLEIECVELGSEIMEVHFACLGMTEAIVRPCTFANGVGTVTIPDRCLEQASNITAWVYQINGTQGHTVKTITLPIVARIRPSKSQDVPTEYINKYAEALTEINEAVNALENGTVTAAKATHALNADKAATATSAASATYATSAGSASTAGDANKARVLMISVDAPYCTISITDGSGHTEKNFEDGLYLVTYEASTGIVLSGVGYIAKNSGSLNNYLISIGKIDLFYYENGNENPPYAAGAEVSLIYSGENSNPVISNKGTLKFYKIGNKISG